MRSLARSAKRVQETGGEFLPTKSIELSDVAIRRFWARANPKPEGCWEWSGWRSALGYGVLYLCKIKGRRSECLAHRYSYTLLTAPISEGLVIDHLCRNRACVNPEHLEAVTQGENVRRANPPRSHCPQGHEYTPENTYSGEKKCKTCVRARQREAYRRKVS